jgi:hypothetical protein
VLEEGEPPTLSVMLKQEELAFSKAISTLHLSPALLPELREALAASKKRKATASSKAKPSGVAVAEVRPSYKPLQQPAGKRKAVELSNSDGVSEPAAWRPAPSALPVEGSAAMSAADEPTAGTSRQRRPKEGGSVYAAVVAGRAVPRQESGPPKPKATGSGVPEPAASTEADRRPKSLGDVRTSERQANWHRTCRSHGH